MDFNSPWGQRFFSSAPYRDRLRDPVVTSCVSPGVLWLGSEAGHLVLRAKMREAILPFPYVFMTLCSIKHEENFSILMSGLNSEQNAAAPYLT